MTAEWYDLGQRLYAARSGRVVPRLLHPPLPRIAGPVAVRARAEHTSIVVTAAVPGTPAATARDSDALTMLHQLGCRITGRSWQTLVTEDRTTLPALTRLARASDPDGEHADTAAHIAWWADRADFPGGSAVVSLLEGCRARWITGDPPAAETQPSTWRRWLDAGEDGCAAMLRLLDLLTVGTPLPLLDSLVEDETWAWTKTQSEHADGWDWRRPDNPARAATGLRARCDAADLFTAALLRDPLHRRRAVHTGHVATGTATAEPTRRTRLTVTCDRMDARMRAGNPITGWAGHPADTDPRRFSGTITDTAISRGRLTLSLSGVSTNRPSPGEHVTLCPAEPNPATMRAARGRYRRLYAARRSWLTTGATPTPNRREVPLEVLIAGADEQ